MLVSCRTPQRRRRPPGSATAIGVALLLASTACSADPPPEQPSTRSTAGSTPLGDYDTSGLALVRGEFCDRVTEGAVTAALGDDMTDGVVWRPGDRLPGSKDISNEFGCSWSSGPVSASAWVFAPPISSVRAGDFAGELADEPCRRLRDAPDLGAPGVAQRCGGADGLTGIYGLVGDAWVGCEISGLTGSESEDVDVVGEWCVAVLEGLRSA